MTEIHNKKIAILAGEGNLPHEIIKNLTKKKLDFFIIPITKIKIINTNIQCCDVLPSVASFELILKHLHDNNCTDIILVGYIPRPNFLTLKLDKLSRKYYAYFLKQSLKGDGTLMNTVLKFFTDHKINILPSSNFLDENLFYPQDGENINKTKYKYDYQKAFNILSDLSKYDIAQAIVIDNGHILAIEAAEGTKLMLERIEYLDNHGSPALGQNAVNDPILFKIPKKNYDARIDLPTIGPDTLTVIKRTKIKTIILPYNQAIIIDKNKLLTDFQKYNIKLFGFYNE